MRRIVVPIVVIAATVMLLCSFASASLTIDVNVAKPNISPYETQQITVSANELGAGVVFVVQPATGPAWQTFLDSNPALKLIWNSLPADIQAQINSAIGNKIVSYALVNWGTNGGSANLNFPADFTGINGAPTTGLGGTYKVLFTYVSVQLPRLLEMSFDCGVWNVVPEVPMGTVAASLSIIAAVGTFVVYKKRRNAN